MEKTEREKLSRQTVLDDIIDIESQFGRKVLRYLLTELIIEFQWWNWPNFRDNFIKEMEKELKK